jgi:hypothetical protein
MRKLIQIFLSLLLFNFYYSSIAQGGWKKKYYLPNSLSSASGNVIETPSGNFIVLGVTYDPAGFNYLTVVGVDSQGNLLWQKNYGNSKFEYLDVISGNTTIKEANCFYQTLCVKDSSNKYCSVLLKFAYNGDTLWQKKYYSTTNNVNLYFQGITKSVDGAFLITGISENFSISERRCLVMKTDLNGNEFWRKFITKNTPSVNIGSSIVQDTASKRIVIVGYQYIGTSTSWDTYSNVLILDSLGNKLTQTTFNNAGGGGFGNVIQLKDKNFITCGAYLEVSGTTDKTKALIVKFDTNGAVIWNQKYDIISPYNDFARVSELPNGDIMVIGSLDTMQNYMNSPIVKLRLTKLDKNGNLKWRKYIGSAISNTTSEGVRSFNPTHDKGFIISSWFPYLNGRPYSIIKIDSTGCDTLEQYCTNIELGLQEVGGKRQNASLSIWPNPATDAVEIKAESYFDKALVIKISDLSGRELEALELPPQKTLRVNTGRYAAGVYFVNALYDGKAIESRKLVIVR